ncbi:MAG: aldolase/citrate lyase family protein [Pseudomonadota bacterium]|nr:aldolase/citrate lyase family protein [Pseudomonadota bacterium]
MRFILIPDDPEMAAVATASGAVTRLLVDLERAGKVERQGAGTWISPHTVDDIPAYGVACNGAELIVRLDPWEDATGPAQVEAVLAAGAERLMLPMIRGTADVAALSAAVAGRAPLMPLIETLASAAALAEICAVPGVDEIYVGLNDLHRDRGDRFMFQPLADGTVGDLARIALGAGKGFGFGGVAPVGQGRLPAELVLSEHVRIGSGTVILSRDVKKLAGHDGSAWAGVGAALNACIESLHRAAPGALEANRVRVAEIVAAIVDEKGGA